MLITKTKFRRIRISMTEVVNWIFIFLGLYWAFCLFWGVRAGTTNN